MIRLEQVSKIYSSNGVISTGFDKVSLSFDKGEFIAITGESGSGKSTLLNVISGLDTYEEGEMYILGQPTSGYTTQEIEDYRKSYIGNIFQSFNLINSYTVYQNVELVLLMSGYDQNQIQGRVKEIISRVGLSEYEKTKASKLSGGQKQRVAIARALAKETPIIVADEPTGNLDVKSAEGIIKLLHEISKDKLVIIVTHNYEQVEPYVTRKIQMHDGHVVEDKVLKHSGQANDQLTSNLSAIESAVDLGKTVEKAKADTISHKNLLKLSARNTFNIPAKFFLLLLVFIFLWSGIFASYTSSKNMLNAVENQGYNPFFSDITPERYVITKEDKSEFTEKDYSKLNSISNIDKVVKQDLLLDATLCLNNGEVKPEENDLYINITIKDLKNLNVDLVKGRMPKAPNEAIYVMEKNANEYLEQVAEQMLTQEVSVNENNTGTKVSDSNLKVTGYGYMDGKLEKGNGVWIDGLLYASEPAIKAINNNIVKQYCSQTLEFGNKEIPVGGMPGQTEAGYTVKVNENVDKGEILIPEDIAMYSDSPVGQSASIENHNVYTDKKYKFSVGAVYTQNNCESLLGEKDYEQVAGGIYLNPADYERMFNMGNFQSSIYVKDMKVRMATEEKLAAAGFDYLSVADAKSSFEGASVISKILYTGSMIGTILVLFLVCYFIIKLILKSRNSYFGIARMLGATRKNCNTMLRWELFIVYNIAFALGLGFMALVKSGVIANDTVVTLVNILSPSAVVLLYVVMGAMAILLANRYARKMFKDSAMEAYREEV